MAESTFSMPSQATESAGLLANGGFSALAETALWLMLVVGLILLLAWMAKRLGGARFGQQGSVRLLSALPVGNREKIVLVQAGDKFLLLGVTPSQVNTLHVFDEMPRDLSAASLQSQPAGERNKSASFQQLLRFALGHRSLAADASASQNLSGKSL